MEILNILFLANAGAAASSNWMIIGLFIILIAFTYFGMIRPQKKQQQRMQMMDKLKKGDEVILVDGLHGKVDKINSDKTIVVDADGIYLTFERMAVRRVIPVAAPATPAAETKAEAPAEKPEEKADETKKEDK